MPREQSTASGNTHIDLTADNVDLQHPHPRQDYKSLLQENRVIRKQNGVLRGELEQLSSRLDEQIRRRMDEHKRRVAIKSEDVSLMQLQNAYKKCQIYKKQASLYRKKVESMGGDSRLQEWERRVQEYARDNNQLKEELKQVKKISKLQQKGLVELGAQGYLKVVGQNEKLREEIRILKKQLDENRREREKVTKNRTLNSSIEMKTQARITEADIKFQEKVKKHIQTEHQDLPNEELADFLQQKVEKDYQKIRALMNDKNKMRDMIDNLKMQLAAKEKENTLLLEKIAALRKANQSLQAQINIKTELDEEQKLSKQNEQRGESKSRLANMEELPPKRRVWKKEHALQQQENTVSQQGVKYPRIEERGSKMEGARVWSHQAFSSKIREIQVQLHQKGHIKNLHVRYEKGEPKRIQEVGQKAKYMVLCCTGSEYIQHIEGYFDKGYLQCLRLTTSSNRVEEFGHSDLLDEQEKGEYFEFRVNQKEFPGALFGENEGGGVRKLGCLIHRMC